MGDRKKYLMLADGMSAHTYKWAKELIECYDLYLLSFNGFSNDIQDILDREHLINCKVEQSVSGGNYSVLKYIYTIKLLIRKIKPDIINAHYITSYGCVAVISAWLAGYKGKMVLSAWGSDILVTPWKNKLYYILTKILLNKANIVTSDSQYMSNMIKKINDDTNVLTFPFGVDKMPKIEFDDKNEKIFFSNRALEKNYNIDKVIEMFYQLNMKDNNRKLIIAHDGTQREYLKKLVGSLGLTDSVVFIGYIDAKEQANCYKKCRYYISLPTSDSTSVSLLEAMSYGCVPIVSDIPANREWVVDGDNGIIYNGLIDKIEHISAHFSFEKNRMIIKEKAIWHDNIIAFKKALDDN